MLNARFVPITQWPGKPTPSYQRKQAQFRANYVQTLDLLEYELGKLHAKEILIQAHFRHEDIRNDGWPKNTAQATDDGVILSFDSPKGPLSFPCDRFNSYDDNLRAIALALEALRAVDRYGVTQHNEQYKGWAQIAAPKKMSVQEAAEVLERYSGIHWQAIIRDPQTFQRAYRLAATGTHPDKPAGSNERFLEVNQAKEIIEKSF
jgi:hypothetical protein